MQLNHPITPCLWFEGQAEDAAKFYCSVFPNSKITEIAYWPDIGDVEHAGKPGAVLTVAFELNGQGFVGLNGGPQFKFDEAVSFQIMCESQQEIDYYWDALRADGGQEGPCGWLKDKFGLSWQVFPSIMPRLLTGPDRAKAARVMASFMEMSKFDLAEIERVAGGAD